MSDLGSPKPPKMIPNSNSKAIKLDANNEATKRLQTKRH